MHLGNDDMKMVIVLDNAIGIFIWIKAGKSDALKIPNHRLDIFRRIFVARMQGNNA